MGFLTELSHNGIKALNRFPITLFWTFFGSCFLIGIYVNDDYSIIKQYDNLSLVLILGVSWLIAVQFVSEALDHNFLSRTLLKISILAGLIGFYFYLEQPQLDDSGIGAGQWALLLLAGHVFVVFAPFINTWEKHKFWNFLKETAIALIRSGIYTLILYLGLALAASALEFLFDVDLNDYIYMQIFIFCLGIVNTFVFLSDFPRVKELQSSIDFHKAIEVLVKFILIPLSLLYLLIVYVYTIKIIMTWELPRGWVTYLISALSLLAFVIHIVIEPVRQSHNAVLIKRFFPLYYYAILPLIPLLFIALYKRVADYNFTELRYLGIVLALWIAGMLIYMLVSKKRRLSLYAKSMFLLILLSTFGPLSAFKISISAQLNELSELLSNLDKQNELKIDESEYDRFKSIIKYLDDRNALGKTEAYFGFDPKTAFAETGSYTLPGKILDSLGVTINNDKHRAIAEPYITKKYKVNFQKANFTEEISEYTNFTLLPLTEKAEEQVPLQLNFDKSNIISLRYYGEFLFETNVTSHLKTLGDKYDYLRKATPDEFTFRLKNEKGDFLIIFESFEYVYKNRNPNIKSGKALVFYRTYEALELP